MAQLSQSKENQLVYLRKIMERNPEMNIMQCITNAMKYYQDRPIPYSCSNFEKPLRIFSEKP